MNVELSQGRENAYTHRRTTCHRKQPGAALTSRGKNSIITGMYPSACMVVDGKRH